MGVGEYQQDRNTPGHSLSLETSENAFGRCQRKGHFRNQGRLLKEVTLDPSLFSLLARTVSPSTPPRTGPSHYHFLWL